MPKSQPLKFLKYVLILVYVARKLALQEPSPWLPKVPASSCLTKPQKVGPPAPKSKYKKIDRPKLTAGSVSRKRRSPTMLADIVQRLQDSIPKGQTIPPKGNYVMSRHFLYIYIYIYYWILGWMSMPKSQPLKILNDNTLVV